MSWSPRDEVTKSSTLSADNSSDLRWDDSVDVNHDDPIMKKPSRVKRSRKKVMSRDNESLKKNTAARF